MSALLTIENLVAGYGSIEALHGVNLEINAGEVVAVLGANGAGKTTLLRSISGMIKPKSGAITMDGTNIAGHKAHRVLQHGIAHVAEGREIFGRLDVDDNLKLGAFIHQKGKLAGPELDMVFELFPRLAERRTQVAGTLSGGEQQMLAIARALLSRPKIMLLDEPSMGLAPIIVGAIFTALEKIVAETSLTVLIVEQNAQAALDLASRGYLLESGTVAQSGNSQELNSAAIEAAYLGTGGH
ncbi:ABC transporter ATP-binding protein [Arthrobacter sp. StoSoilA2]|uniref:ABC transporter ATP-binding protein n=1 Tax=Arthrobacter sp. StoSoilA2 TaxID=2830990 RepID=UPI001CC47620|nr:ABC transporter ATP-binding protein [Arthrobacter sp. StoSoilA2]BCW36003.1 ABC transporter ATP-binding protein [Arthrobacter sp. StoSoilA2]